jgi:hypothetical protein
MAVPAAEKRSIENLRPFEKITIRPFPVGILQETVGTFPEKGVGFDVYARIPGTERLNQPQAEIRFKMDEKDGVELRSGMPGSLLHKLPSDTQIDVTTIWKDLGEEKPELIGITNYSEENIGLLSQTLQQLKDGGYEFLSLFFHTKLCSVDYGHEGGETVLEITGPRVLRGSITDEILTDLMRYRKWVRNVQRSVAKAVSQEPKTETI